MGCIFGFLLCYFEPHSLFSKTITTGGDTGSHYFTAQYLKDYLLPHGKMSGWCQGNLAGFPMLQNYFPLPFFLMAVLSSVFPLQIAFKLVTVLGTFLLPPCTYLLFRLLKQPFPTPIIGAVFTLPFLFMEGNSMWGANIPSTLAGTFCYSLGFSFSVLWLGLLYRTISDQRGSTLGCSLLLAVIGLCHGYTLLFVVVGSLFFLFTKENFGTNFKKLLQIFVVAFSLMAFWLVPLIAFLPYTTRFNILWIFFDWKQIMMEVFPPILLPFIALTFAGALWAVLKKAGHLKTFSIRPWTYVWFIAVCGLALYGIGYRIGVVDVRFLPFFQFFLIIGGAMIFSLVPVSQRACTLVGFIALFLTLLWVDGRETFIGKWIRSNYNGFETKELWGPFSSVNRYLRGSPNDPRVVYEHSMIHNGAGTVRAFEDLPLFSGRSTLEGVYIQASLCAPFIFYLQSEISQKSSMPIPDYNYSRFNLKRGIEHLRLFNVRDLIISEPASKEAFTESPEFRLRHRSGPYEVYEFLANPGRYVVPVKYKPVLVPTKDWRRLSYRWFRLGDLSVPLVFKDEVDEKDSLRFHIVEKPDVRRLPRELVEASTPLTEVIGEEEILIEGAIRGRPLLIKVSYHPNWKVEGADRVYLASPAFMLIYPDSSSVRLFYGRTWPDYAGISLTTIALLFLLFSQPHYFSRVRNRLSSWFDQYCLRGVMVSTGILTAAAVSYLLHLSPEFPALPYNRGIECFVKGDYGGAKGHFKEVIERYPQTLMVDQAAYQYAMCFFREKDWADTISSLRLLLETYPDTGRAAEALYHMGLCYMNLGKVDEACEQFGEVIEEFPGEVWAGFAGDRLKEIPSR